MKIKPPPPYAVYDDKVISGFFGDYRWLSNFWLVYVDYRGGKFMSVEAAYQAAKATTLEDFKSFFLLEASEAKKRGAIIKCRPDWEAKKLDIMTFLVFQKFSNSSVLRKQLLDTGKKQLIEANDWRDKFWGIHYLQVNDSEWQNMGGQNHLGEILMRVRKALS
jgi:ribA/ribD-fused uncharacterized protein